MCILKVTLLGSIILKTISITFLSFGVFILLLLFVFVFAGRMKMRPSLSIQSCIIKTVLTRCKDNEEEEDEKTKKRRSCCMGIIEK